MYVCWFKRHLVPLYLLDSIMIKPNYNPKDKLKFDDWNIQNIILDGINLRTMLIKPYNATELRTHLTISTCGDLSSSRTDSNRVVTQLANVLRPINVRSSSCSWLHLHSGDVSSFSSADDDFRFGFRRHDLSSIDKHIPVVILHIKRTTSGWDSGYETCSSIGKWANAMAEISDTNAPIHLSYEYLRVMPNDIAIYKISTRQKCIATV